MSIKIREKDNKCTHFRYTEMLLGSTDGSIAVAVEQALCVCVNVCVRMRVCVCVCVCLSLVIHSFAVFVLTSVTNIRGKTT